MVAKCNSVASCVNTKVHTTNQILLWIWWLVLCKNKVEALVAL